MARLRNEEIRKFLDGDDSVFPKIFVAYRNKINYLAIEILHNEADCEEVVQNTFIKIIERRNELRDEKAFNSWIYRIAYNTSLDLYRKNKRRLTSGEQDIEEFLDTNKDIEHTLKKKVIIETIQNQIDDLPSDMREVCVLRFVAGCSIDEISSIMDIPKGTVKSRLHRAKSKLKEALITKEITPTVYLSLVISPLTPHLFKTLSNNSAMAPASELKIIRAIEHATNITAESVTNGFTDLLLSGMGVSVVTVLSALLVGGFGVYTTLDQAIIEIPSTAVATQVEEVVYLKEVTNKNLQVALVFDGKVNVDRVSVSMGDEKLKIEAVDNNKCTFIVSQNGTYSIQYEDSKEEVTIDNIDKQGPELLNISKDNGLIRLEMSDNMSGIDFETSYVQEGDKKIQLIPINETSAYVADSLVETSNIRFYDKVGNYQTYQIEATKIE